MLAEALQKLEKMRSQALSSNQKAGKMSARDMCHSLMDPGTFSEINTFAKHRCTNFDMESKGSPGDGVITGYGSIFGRTVFVYAQDFSVLGGSGPGIFQ